MWWNRLWNNPRPLKRNKIQYKIGLLQYQRRGTWPYCLSAKWCIIYTNRENTLSLPNSLGSTHRTGRHNLPHELKHINFTHQGSASFSRSDGSRSSPCPADCCHIQGGISCGYSQSHNKFHQRHCGWRPRAATRELWAVDAAQTPWAQAHRQEDDLPFSRTNCDRLLHCLITSQVFWHQQNLVLATPSLQHSLCDK